MSNIHLERQIIYYCKEDKIEYFKKLIECNNIDISFYDDTGANILTRTACKYNSLNCLKYLLNINNNTYTNNEIVTICKNGNLEVLKYIYQINPNSISSDIINNGFIISCQKNFFEMAQFLHSIDNNVNFDIHKSLNDICKCGNFKFLKWLINLTDINIVYNDLFVSACIGGNIDIVKWVYHIDVITKENIDNGLLKTKNVRITQFLYNLEITSKDIILFDILNDACNNNYTGKAKFIFSSFGKWADINKNNGEIFINVCKNNNLEMLIYLLGIDCSLFDSYSKECFFISCENNFIELSKFIYSYSKFDLTDTINELFSKLCKNNSLDVIKWIYNNYKINLNYNNYSFFRIACENGHLDLVKWLLDVDYNNIKALDNYAFINSCKNNHLSVAKLLYSLDSKLNINYNELFVDLCLLNNLDGMMWLHSLNLVDINEYIDIIINYICENKYLKMFEWIYFLEDYLITIDNIFNDRYEKESIFHYLCRYNYIDLLKYLFYIDPNININSKDEEALCLACQEGHFELAKLLYSKGEIDTSINNNWCFKIALGKGYFNIVKWLYSIIEMDIHLNNDYFFRFCCYTGYLEIAKWIYSLGEIDINMLNNEPLQLACYYNNIDIAKWIYSFNNIDITFNNNIIFYTVCNYNLVNIAIWIASLKPDLYKIILNDANTEILEFSVIKYLSITESKYVNEIQTCPICYDEESNIITSCNHQFCISCVQTYMNKNINYLEKIPCPYCREENLKLYKIDK